MTDSSNASSGGQVHEGYIIDAENAAEMARLMIQDRLLTQSMGGLVPEPIDLSAVSRVLDLGCGPGGWLLDLGTYYPHIQGVGIDVSHLMIQYATNLVTSQGLSNVRFQEMDATQPLHFADNMFDLVNGRILTGFLTTQQWSSLLQECTRIIMPGGILRLVEAEWGFTNSAALDALQGIAAFALYRSGHSFSPHGRNVGTSAVLSGFLRRAGYQNVQHRAYAIDFSAETAIHESNRQNMLVFHKLFQPFLVQMQIATKDELQHLYEQMEKEMQAEDFCAIDYYLTVFGSKPKE